MNKDVRILVSSLVDMAGVTVEPGGSGHLKVYRNGQFVTSMSSTPSDPRWRDNVLADLRRSGITPGVNTKPRKPYRPIPVPDLAAHFTGLRKRRQVAAFARFAQQLGEVRGLRIYSTADSAEGAIHAIGQGKTKNPAPWTVRLLSIAWREWARSQQTEAKLEALEPEPLPVTASTSVKLVLDLTTLTETLAHLGIRLEVEQD